MSNICLFQHILITNNKLLLIVISFIISSWFLTRHWVGKSVLVLSFHHPTIPTSLPLTPQVHERSVQSDFLLTILKDVVMRRSDLQLILMSATVDCQKFSSYFNRCPVISIPGRTFPVEVRGASVCVCGYQRYAGGSRIFWSSCVFVSRCPTWKTLWKRSATSWRRTRSTAREFLKTKRKWASPSRKKVARLCNTR